VRKRPRRDRCRLHQQVLTSSICRPTIRSVRFAVGEGHTVFMVSWRKHSAELRQATGTTISSRRLTALRLAAENFGSEKVNALGFCVGGTLLRLRVGGRGPRRR
jgi:polyhydroxyalkanoate synthase